ncbi:MAG: ABC transporter ATP-binding protein [Gammaproteobacteria bacterium]
MTAAIALDGVGRRFATGVEALAGVDLAIAPGALVSLLGPSGCGKSTILRMIAGLDAPDRGSLRVTPAAGAAQPVLSYVFQEPTLMPWARVYDNVRLPLRIAGLDPATARARVDPMLQAVGLARFERAFPAELSGGMRMRASIARALVTHPDVLLMDEPFAALDEITRHRLNADLLALWQAQGFTLVFVTHSVFEAVFLAQRVVVMSARPGRIMADLVVDAPYPRGPDWRTDPAYARLCRQASAALESGHAEAGA